MRSHQIDLRRRAMRGHLSRSAAARATGLALVTGLVALVAACGGSGGTSAVATIPPGGGGGSAIQSTSPGASVAIDDALLTYARCMRDKGVPKFPDPVNGSFSFNQDEIDIESPAYKQANQACGAVQGREPVVRTFTDAEQEQMREFAQCMRDSGVPNFPDPVFGNESTVTSGLDPESPAFKSAEQTCTAQVDRPQ